MEQLENSLQHFRFKQKIDIRWSDLDALNHVNNAVYLTYFESARGYYYHETCRWDWSKEGFILASATVNYIRPILFPSECYIFVRTSKIGTKSMEQEYIIIEEKNGEKIMMANGKAVLVMYDFATNKSVEVPLHVKEKLSNYEPATIQ